MKKTTNVRIITCTNQKTETDLNIFRVPNFELPKIKFMVFIASVLFYISALKIIKKVDVIYINGANPNDFPIVILSRLLKVKVVLCLHGNPTSEKRFFKQYLESFDGIICASKYNKNVIMSYCKVKNITIIPYGVNKNDFLFCNDDVVKSKKWLKNNFPTGKLNILFLGRLVKEKGVLDIPEIAKRMPENMFFMAGTGILEEELKSRATDNLKVLGFVEENDLKRLFLSCDLCIFPSYTEPFGIMILEAMSYGKPIIASRTGGIPDILENVGILINPMDVDGFVEAIKTLEDSNKREMLSRASFKRVKEFSWDKTAKRTMIF